MICESNPYDDQLDGYKESLFYNQSDILKELKKFVSRPRISGCALIGGHGMGKTWLMNKYYWELRKAMKQPVNGNISEKVLCPVWVTLKKNPRSAREVYKQIIDSAWSMADDFIKDKGAKISHLVFDITLPGKNREPKKDFEDDLRCIYDEMKLVSKDDLKLVFFIDDVYHINQNQLREKMGEELESIMKSPWIRNNIVFVLALTDEITHVLPTPTISGVVSRVYLKAFEEKGCEMLMRIPLVTPLPLEVEKAILSAAGRHPCLIHQLMYQVCETNGFSDVSKINSNTIQKIIHEEENKNLNITYHKIKNHPSLSANNTEGFYELLWHFSRLEIAEGVDVITLKSLYPINESTIKDILRNLSFQGVIYEESETYLINGSIMKEWSQKMCIEYKNNSKRSSTMDQQTLQLLQVIGLWLAPLVQTGFSGFVDGVTNTLGKNFTNLVWDLMRQVPEQASPQEKNAIRQDPVANQDRIGKLFMEVSVSSKKAEEIQEEILVVLSDLLTSKRISFAVDLPKICLKLSLTPEDFGDTKPKLVNGIITWANGSPKRTENLIKAIMSVREDLFE